MDYLSLFHWSFLAVALGVACLTDLLKRAEKILPKNKLFHLLIDGRVLSALLGFMAGWIPGMPIPDGISAGISSALYYMTAGILSSWTYSLLEKVFRDILPDKIKDWLSSIMGSKKDGAEEEQ